MANPFGGSGGIGGIGGPGMRKMLETMQTKMMKEAELMNGRLDEARLEGSSGGGMVKVSVNGHGNVLAITINKDVVDPNDVEMLQDLVSAAVNEALEKSETMKTDEQQKLMPAGIPGLPGLI